MHKASCTCGQLTFVTEQEPVRVSVCHCLACQQRTGSAFAVQARFRRDGASVAGKSSVYTRVGDEGTSAHFHFCAVCGVTIYYTADSFPEFIMVPVGVFGNPKFPAPTVTVYEERQHAWVQLLGDIEHLR